VMMMMVMKRRNMLKDRGDDNARPTSGSYVNCGTTRPKA
jgi:hypothetical protein